MNLIFEDESYQIRGVIFDVYKKLGCGLHPSASDSASIRVALAHDSFTQEGGAERVIENFHAMYPNAPVFTLVIDKKLKEKYKTWNIKTSGLQKLFNIFPKLQYLLPFIPFAVSSLDFSEFDVVISSSSGWMKNIKVPKNTIHINYCHTPARFLWVDENYLWQELPLILKPFYIFGKLLIWILKKWDYAGAQRVSVFLANSTEVQKRIKTVYGKESTVLYPSVNVNFWHKTKEKENYFLLAGRLQPHKNNELIVRIFNELNLPLHVVGTGRQEEYLKSIAKTNIHFLGKVSDEVLRNEYSGALGYIYPQIEDFGLMPIEAAACGTATLGFAKGGSLETIVPKVTGELFSKNNIEEISAYIKNWDPNKYSVENLRTHAEKFGQNKFKEKFIEIIHTVS